MKSHCFYLSTIRCLFGMVRKNSTDLSQHHADHDLSVRESTLCVMSGAPLGGTDFRLLTRRSEYATISLILGTPVRHTTLRVMFCARRCSVALGLLDRLLGHLDRQAQPRTPERVRRPTLRATNGAEGCLLDIPARLRSGIFRRRERHAHAMARRHRAGSGDRENPKQGGANRIPGLPVMTGPP